MIGRLGAKLGGRVPRNTASKRGSESNRNNQTHSPFLVGRSWTTEAETVIFTALLVKMCSVSKSSECLLVAQLQCSVSVSVRGKGAVVCWAGVVPPM